MAVREQQWLETIQIAKQSGLPVNQWCHENGIAESTFYRWQQKIRQHLLDSAEHKVKTGKELTEVLYHASKSMRADETNAV